MSCQRECAFIEKTPGAWYLLLAFHEHGELRLGQAAAYGPFATEEAVDEYLSDNFSNPGGMFVWPFEAEHPVDGVYAALIAQAHKPETRSSFGFFL